jgi:predicted metalloprotease with PDZ domain
VWLVVALVVFGVVGGKLLIGAVRDAARQRMARLQAPPQPRAFFGAEDFDDHEGGGVLVEAALPDSPADRAGLIDGDVITTFDGVSIQGEDDFRELLRRTAIGKTVEVKYLRDGETRATTLTTIPSNAYDEMPSCRRAARGFWVLVIWIAWRWKAQKFMGCDWAKCRAIALPI